MKYDTYIPYYIIYTTLYQETGSTNDALLGYSSSCKCLQKLHSDLQSQACNAIRMLYCIILYYIILYYIILYFIKLYNEFASRSSTPHSSIRRTKLSLSLSLISRPLRISLPQTLNALYALSSSSSSLYAWEQEFNGAQRFPGRAGPSAAIITWYC